LPATFHALKEQEGEHSSYVISVEYVNFGDNNNPFLSNGPTRVRVVISYFYLGLLTLNVDDYQENASFDESSDE
jgi:hypothetical protein